MFTHVIHAEYAGGHRLRLKFDDGAEGVADLVNSLDGPVFLPLRDACEFAKFHIALGTVSWPSGADFAPEYLRELAGLPVANPHFLSAA